MVAIIPPKNTLEEGDGYSPTKEGDEIVEPTQAPHAFEEGSKPTNMSF